MVTIRRTAVALFAVLSQVHATSPSPSPSPSASSSPTVRPWPCPSTSGPPKFALQVIGFPADEYDGDTQNYTGSTLGVLSNGSAPAVRPVQQQPIAQWYLDNQTLYVDAASTGFPQKLAGAAVIDTANTIDSSDPKYQLYWQNWIFNSSDVACQYKDCRGVANCTSPCTLIACTITAADGAPDGILNCQDTMWGYQDSWAQLPVQSDAVVGSEIEAGAAFGPPPPGGLVQYNIIPSCQIKRRGRKDRKAVEVRWW